MSCSSIAGDDTRATATTNTPSSLYETVTPDEAFRLARKPEIPFTPKHGSWLDIAEVELSALTAQCPESRRIGSIR